MRFSVLIFVLLVFDFSCTQNVEDHNPAFVNHKNWNLLPHKECGREKVNPDSKVQTRVMGGEDAYYGQHPWIIALFKNYSSIWRNGVHCAGAIINRKYFITTAHCCAVKNNVKYVRAGVYDINDSGPVKSPSGNFDPPLNIVVEEVILHENFNNSVYDNICLIRRQGQTVYNDHVQPLCLPTYNRIQESDGDYGELEIMGWGMRDQPAGKMNILQWATVPMVTTNDCKRLYAGGLADWSNTVCAGGKWDNKKRKGSCQGDGGTPAVKSYEVNGKKTYYMLGIGDFRVKNKKPNENNCDLVMPAGYLKVANYITWIMDNISR